MNDKQKKNKKVKIKKKNIYKESPLLWKKYFKNSYLEIKQKNQKTKQKKKRKVLILFKFEVGKYK